MHQPLPYESMRSLAPSTGHVGSHLRPMLVSDLPLGTCREAPCKAWEACMSRDPTIVGRTNVVAETFAGVINSFVDPISWKTMVSFSVRLQRHIRCSLDSRG